MPKKKNNDTTDGLEPEAEEVKTAPKIKDVANPGETPPSATARPIITGHGSILKQDPMMADKSEPDEKITTKKAELTIKPETESEPESTETSEESPKGENKDEPPEANEAEKGETKNDEDSTGSDSAAIDSLATSAGNKKQDAKQAEEERKKTEKINELIASKRYSIPITEGGHKASSQRFMSWLLLILLASAVGVYLAIDAGYLDIGIALPFDLIKN